MKIILLGSSAGGGFPQWNCNCVHCRGVRAGAPGYAARTQCSIAASADGARWLLLDASPDLRQQIAATPSLWPPADGERRASPIKAVVVTSGDVDHIAGLLTMRERESFDLYATARVLRTLDSNRIFEILAPDVVARRELPLSAPIAIDGAGAPLGLEIEAFAVPGKIALYLEDAKAEGFGTRVGDTIGLRVRDVATDTSFFYIPGCAAIDAPLAARLRGADLVLFDGTLWHDDEMIDQGLMPKTGSRMGHINMSGPAGSIAALAGLDIARKVFVHVNNSNPTLDAASPERARAEAAGWTIGEDGMEFHL